MLAISNEKEENLNDKNYYDKKLPTLVSIVMTAFITTFSSSALNLSVPDISSEFNAGAVSIGWIVTGYILASAALSVPFGRIADLYGKKPVLVTGLALFTVCSFLCGLAWNIETMNIFRIVQGLGAAMLYATNNAILVATYPPQMRGKMLGFSVSFTYLGLSLGPVIGGVMNHQLGWRSVFYLTAAYSAVALVVAVLKLEEPKAAPSDTDATMAGEGGSKTQQKKSLAEKLSSMDMSGCAFYTASLVLIMYGFTEIMASHIARLLLLAGVVLLVIFIYHEDHTDAPVVDIDMFRKNRVFTLSNLAALLNYGASYAVSYVLSIYLQGVQGYSSQVAGFILITSPLFQTLLSPLAGRLSDRVAPYKLASLGMSLTGVGIFMFIFTSAEMSLLYILLSLSIIGIGFALFSSPNTNAVMGSVDKDVYGVASSVLATSRTLGHTTSMAIVSSVVMVRVGNITLSDASPDSIILAMKTIFVIFTVLCILGVFCSMSRNEKQKK